jgi:hypothetical protein
LVISFLAGYFSDGALAKLAEIANVIFGHAEAKKSKNPSSVTETAGSGPNLDSTSAPGVEPLEVIHPVDLNSE